MQKNQMEEVQFDLPNFIRNFFKKLSESWHHFFQPGEPGWPTLASAALRHPLKDWWENVTSR